MGLEEALLHEATGMCGGFHEFWGRIWTPEESRNTRKQTSWEIRGKSEEGDIYIKHYPSYMQHRITENEVLDLKVLTHMPVTDGALLPLDMCSIFNNIQVSFSHHFPWNTNPVKRAGRFGNRIYIQENIKCPEKYCSKEL